MAYFFYVDELVVTWEINLFPHVLASLLNEFEIIV